MTSLCVVGDSAIAAIKSGYELIRQDFPSLETRFFGAWNQQFAALKLNGGSLTADEPEVRNFMALTSGGLQEIVIDDYDAFAVCALGFDVSRIIQIYASHRTENMAVSDTAQLVSEECFLAAARETLAASLAIGIAAKIRSRTTRPIYILPTPRRGTGFRKGDFGSLYRAGHADDALLGTIFDDLCRTSGAGRFPVIAQDAATLATPLFTQLQFCTSPPRLKSGALQRQPDLRHMNGEFGALTFRSLADALLRDS